MSGHASTAGQGSRHDSPVASQAGTSHGGTADPSSHQGGKDNKPKYELTDAQLIGRRVDLPAEAFHKAGQEQTRFTARPGYNEKGKPIKVQLNLFPVSSWSDSEIYQYDINVSPNIHDSRGLVTKVWNTTTVLEALRAKGGKWLCDGHKLAWSSEKIDRNETRIVVDLDTLEEKEAQSPEVYKKVVDRNSVYYLTIRQTKTIRLSYLKAYLQGKIPWDAHVLECMNFFDHCMRQYPSQKLLCIKRNFYDRDRPKAKLGFDLVINQGIYSTVRLSEAINRGGTGLAINVDRCNTAFWPFDSLDQLALRMVNCHKYDWSHADINKLVTYLRPEERVHPKTGEQAWTMSEAFLCLRRMTKLKFVVNHRGKMGETKVYTLKRLIFEQKYGRDGAHSKAVTFEKKMPDGTTKTTTVHDHYLERWGFRLLYPYLPIIETTRGGLYPMELCNTLPDQRYLFKLNPEQTKDMIKKAVCKPPQRLKDIMEGVRELDWPKDPYLNAFGIKISPQMAVTQARLLQNPEVSFGNQKINPGTSGRWDLRGKTFLEPNAYELKSWSFICLGQACKQNELENFARQFSGAYRNHGAKITKAPYMRMMSYSEGNYSDLVKIAVQETTRYCKEYPQIIFFLLENKNILSYERIKKTMDCTFNIVSQCLQGGHASKCNAQYISNLAMKVNSKLGGVTCRVPVRENRAPAFWSRPTLIIGLDVSHGGAIGQNPSMAALTMSLDKDATRYAAACETNGYRVEVVRATTMHMMLPKLVRHWKSINGCAPRHVYFIRDGVSEGQFQDVLDIELGEIRRIFRENDCHPQFTVIIATKRHHVRFFPKSGDRTTADHNGNPLPGTLVERDVTHPQHFDFYLCSHVAIQGTARPVHYQVILDEAGIKPDDLQKMIYQQCYQYCRSTTPVSLHPAVYYSHLASNRARCHENIDPDHLILAYGKPGFPYGKMPEEIYPDHEEQSAIAPYLIPMAARGVSKDAIRFMNTTMWYV
ncbi:Piwi-domain-containing protein [Durotheca rogersii]|uniref:Piwi-domain-containing protein n=1 Tax=Durotheca rogersii TaxID=419775 RepID=UPI002220CAF5|nr:Piwi-domain-containing protein [Durotheca rogersii]KAI5863615.1 Piwi-domain-containing protein [Durotheca rogersii]